MSIRSFRSIKCRSSLDKVQQENDVRGWTNSYGPGDHMAESKSAGQAEVKEQRIVQDRSYAVYAVWNSQCFKKSASIMSQGRRDRDEYTWEDRGRLFR